MYVLPKKNGGKRAGAGRKYGPRTELERLALTELSEEAEKSIRFLVGVRDNPSVSWGVRVVAAQDLIDRRFGKAKQMLSVMNEGDPILIQFVPFQGLPAEPTPASDPASPSH